MTPIDLVRLAAPSSLTPLGSADVEKVRSLQEAMMGFLGAAKTGFERLIAMILATVEDFERQHGRAQLLAALKRRRQWRTSDASRLRKMKLSEVARRRVSELEKSHKLGRGVVTEPTCLAARFKNDFVAIATLADEKTPPEIRREIYKRTRWFPEFVEEAYRGELAKAQRRLHDRTTPHLRAHEIAEQSVAEAAGISAAQVRKLCHRVRADRNGAPPDTPATSAAELGQERRHAGRTIALASLAPELTAAILDGRQPSAIRLTGLLNGDIPVSWREQRTLFGAKSA